MIDLIQEAKLVVSVWDDDPNNRAFVENRTVRFARELLRLESRVRELETKLSPTPEQFEAMRTYSMLAGHVQDGEFHADAARIADGAAYVLANAFIALAPFRSPA